MMEFEPTLLDFVLPLAGGVGLFLFLFGPLLIVARLQNVSLIYAVLCLVPVVGVPLYILRIVSKSSKFGAEKVQ